VESNLVTFLLDVARDPDKLAAFQANPEDELAHAGLTQQEQDAILSKDSDRIRDAITAAMPRRPGVGQAGLAAVRILDPVMVTVVIHF